jgi:ferrous iron transport protein A
MFRAHFAKIVKAFLFLAIVLDRGIMKLSQLKVGSRGKITGFESPELELKLMEMGCLPGEEVLVEQIAPLGDPISIKVAGYSLSLRKNEANQILVEDVRS